MFTLRTLGGLILEGPSGPASGRAAQRRRLALLALLGVAGDKGLSRDKLASYLWPESDAASARHLLSDSIYVLRKALSAELLVASGEFLRLDPDVVWCDVSEFEGLLEEKRFEEALNLYAGPFLDGFYLGGEGEFDVWVEGERQRLADEYARALESAAEQAEVAGDPKRAVEWWKKLVAHDPYNSRAMLRLMEALAAAGDPANALELLRVHELRLRDELGLELPEELQAFADRLRREPVAGGAEAEETRLTPQEPAPSVRVVPALLPDTEPVTSRAKAAKGAKRLFSGRNAILGGVLALSLLGISAAGQLVMRVTGFGPAVSLVAKDVIDEGKRIILSDFETNTGDSDLAVAVTEAFRIDLAQSSLVRLAEADYIAGVLARMEKGAPSLLDYDLAREVAIREGIEAVITGEINSVGAGYVLSARLISVETGQTLAAHRVTAEDSIAIIPAIDRLSNTLRERIGESLKSIRSNPPLEQVTTRSLQALRKYSQGEKLRGQLDKRLALLEEAVALDTTFAAAWGTIGTILYTNGEEPSRQVETITKAFHFRDRLTERERHDVEGLYHIIVTGDYAKASIAYRQLLDEYPNDWWALNVLAWLYHAHLRDWANAEKMAHLAIGADSSHLQPYANAAIAKTNLGKFDEAQAMLSLGLAELPGNHWLNNFHSSVASARGDYDTAEKRVREIRERAGKDNLRWLSNTSRALGNVSVVRGRLAEAENHFRDAMAVNEKRGLAGEYLQDVSNLAYVELSVREAPDAAVRKWEDALERYPLRSFAPFDRPYLELAIACARSNDPDRAKALVAEFDAEVNLVLQRRRKSARHHSLGLIALAEGRVADAITEFRLQDDATGCPICALPDLGLAYDAAGEADSAVAVYERYISTPYMWRLTLDSRWLHRIYKRLGEIYSQRADTTNAIRNYAKLVDLWRDADPELQPQVDAARRAMEALATDK